MAKAATTEKREVKTVVNAANGLNLREAPRGAILATLPYGTVVKVVKDEGEWSEVKAGKLTGWVVTYFLRKE